MYAICKDDIRSIIWSNIITILQQTGADPRQLNVRLLRDWRLYEPGDTWTVPLLMNLRQVPCDNWEIMFDDESCMTADDDEIEFMMQAICTGSREMIRAEAIPSQPLA